MKIENGTNKKLLDQKTQVVLFNSKLNFYMKQLLFWMHSLVILLTLIIVIEFEINHTQKAVAVFTFIFIILIIIIDISYFAVKYFLVKDFLSEFWGEKKVDAKIIKFSKNANDEQVFLRMKDKDIIEEKNATAQIYWEKNWFFKPGIIIELFLEQRTQMVVKCLDVYYDIDQKILIINGIVYDKNIDMYSFLVFNINHEDKIVKWSGMLPDFPFYGEWMYNIEEKNK